MKALIVNAGSMVYPGSPAAFGTLITDEAKK
jgi:hypothetical protein